MSHDSESIHAADTDVASHHLLDSSFAHELLRPRRPGPSEPAAVSGPANREGEVFVIPGNPPIITEGTRLTRILELAQSQPALPATAVFAAGELAQIARLYRERGFQPTDSPTLSELLRWIDQLGGIQPVKVDA